MLKAINTQITEKKMRTAPAEQTINSSFAIGLKIDYYEIAMSQFSHKPKMIRWLFHATIEKQIIYA